MEDQVLIRPARASDCPQIVRLIKELAEFDRMPDAPKIDARQLEVDGFGELPLFRCLVAVDASSASGDKETSNDGLLVGLVVYFYSFYWDGKAVFMDDLYVMPSHRSKGVGSKLLKNCLSVSLSAGAVSSRLRTLDWNSRAIKSFESRGALDFTKTFGFWNFKMTKSAMEKFVANINKVDGITVRYTGSGMSDYEAVSAMQRGLAEWMKFPDYLKVTPKMLMDGCAGTPPLIDILVAESSTDGELLGFCLHFGTYSTWEGRGVLLKDMFVKEQHRHKGVATLLWQTIVQRALNKGCTRFDFEVLKTDVSAISYFEKRGAVNVSESEGWNTMIILNDATVKIISS